MTYDRGYLNNQFQGRVRPTPVPKYYLDIKPAWQKIHLINGSPDNESSTHCDLKISIKSPTERFPTASVFLQLKNGHDSTFTRLIDPISELDSIILFLSNQRDSIIKTLESLKPLEQKIMEMRIQMNLMAQINPGGLGEFDDNRNQSNGLG